MSAKNTLSSTFQSNKKKKGKFLSVEEEMKTRSVPLSFYSLFVMFERTNLYIFIYIYI